MLIKNTVIGELDKNPFNPSPENSKYFLIKILAQHNDHGYYRFGFCLSDGRIGYFSTLKHNWTQVTYTGDVFIIKSNAHVQHRTKTIGVFQSLPFRNTLPTYCTEMLLNPEFIRGVI